MQKTSNIDKLKRKKVMKPIRIFFMFIVAIIISCEKIDNSNDSYSSEIDSVIYISNFSTEINPIAIATDKNNGYLYLANNDRSNLNTGSKIQKFNINGEFEETIIDFVSFNYGIHDRYAPIDLCISDNNIFVLAQPMFQTDSYWLTNTGFCILHFDLDGKWIKEFDFSELKDYWGSSAISYFSGFIYVANKEVAIRKINANNGVTEDIQITKRTSTPVTDMVVVSEEKIYLTGQGPWEGDVTNFDNSVCFITQMDCTKDETRTFFSKSRTGTMTSMFNNPGLTIKDNGNIYLSTFYGRSLEIYNSNNKLILQKDIKTNEFEETLPIDVTLYGTNIYILDYKNNKVHIYQEE